MLFRSRSLRSSELAALAVRTRQRREALFRRVGWRLNQWSPCQQKSVFVLFRAQFLVRVVADSRSRLKKYVLVLSAVAHFEGIDADSTIVNSLVHSLCNWTDLLPFCSHLPVLAFSLFAFPRSAQCTFKSDNWMLAVAMWEVLNPGLLVRPL